MAIYAYGNMMHMDCDALVISTNGFVKSDGTNVMGKGIAKQVAELIPAIPKVLGLKLQQEGNIVHHLGNHNGVQLISCPVKPVTKVMESPTDAVMHMRTKLKVGDVIPGWACVADIEIIKESLIQLKELADANPTWKRILVPYLGCGAGELEWSNVKPLVTKYLDDRFIIVTFKKGDHKEMERKYRLIIAGGRDFDNGQLMLDTLNQLINSGKLDSKNLEIVCGEAKGADTWGKRIALGNGIPVKSFPANWSLHGNSAGYKRNEEMAVYADGLLAFHDGNSRGTGHMINLANQHKLDVWVENY